MVVKTHVYACSIWCTEIAYTYVALIDAFSGILCLVDGSHVNKNCLINMILTNVLNICT